MACPSPVGIWRRPFVGLCLAAAFAWLAAANSHVPSKLTVVLDFRGPYSARSVEEMERESERMVRPAGLQLDWQAPMEAAQNSYQDLVVVRFQGTCEINPAPIVYDELGPLAFTYSTAGSVQPFSEVACDKVAATLRSAMWGRDFSRGDVLYGRALGRVLVHELVHILTRSGKHVHQGVEQPAFSAKELVAGSLPLSPADLELLRSFANATRP